MNQAIGKNIADYLTEACQSSLVLAVAKKILDSRRIQSDFLTRDYIGGFLTRCVRSCMGRWSHPTGWRFTSTCRIGMSSWSAWPMKDQAESSQPEEGIQP